MDTWADGHECEISDGEQCIYCGIAMTDEDAMIAESQPDWML